MLQYLHIQNLALLETATLDFTSGFTVVTGETGAGKSVLLGALYLLSGGRADKSVIGKFKEFSHIEAQFHFKDVNKINEILTQLELPTCEEGCLILKRILFRDKGTKILINDTLSTLSVLQKLGEAWIDFHGANEPQKLFNERYQLEMLDSYADLHSLLKEYTSYFSQWQISKQKINRLLNDERLTLEEIAFYQEQLRKMSQLPLHEEGIGELESKFNRLQRHEDWQKYSGQLATGLVGEKGILNQLRPYVKVASVLEEIDPAHAEALAKRLNSLIIELEDLGSEFEALQDVTNLDLRESILVKDQMNAWLELKRKYGNDLSFVLQKKKSLEEKIAQQTDIEGCLEKLKSEEGQLQSTLKTLAAKIREKRIKAAKGLAAKVEKLIDQLGFKKGSIAIQIIDEEELKTHGDSRCQFLFSGNAGQELLPLNKIASSGETARVMLALKAVLASVDETAVLVFDEVDANVGGEIGAKVGEELRKLAQNHQVFCVTHLPQVAAQAQQHFLVIKDQEEHKTMVNITPIHFGLEERVTELARMLGDRTSSSALKHAEELLKVVSVRN